MSDIPRRLQPVIEELMGSFRVVILQGARQVGKSTLAGAVVVAGRGTVLDLDDPTLLDAMTADPRAQAPLRCT